MASSTAATSAAVPLESWAVAALAIVDREGAPLILRTFTSSPSVLDSPDSPHYAHLYVGPEDVIKIHFLLFSSLDRCDELYRINKKLAQAAYEKQLEIKKQQQQTASTSSREKRQASTASAGKDPVARRPITMDNPYHQGGASATPASATTRDASSSAATGSGGGNAPIGGSEQNRLMSAASDVRFAGKLIHSYRFTSYGFCSVTGVKTVLVTVGGAAPQDAVVPLCRSIYEHASSALCNPFHTPLQCWKAQQQFMQERYHELLNAEQQLKDQGQPMPRANSGMPSGRDSLGAENRAVLGLPVSCYEHSWPRGCSPLTQSTAMGSAASTAMLLEEPTLALSKTFNAQLESILSTFTASSRSRILR